MNSLQIRQLIQSALGVKEDGDFGKRTFAAYSRASRANDIIKLKTIQKLLGLPAQDIDGDSGPQTNGLMQQLGDSPDAADWPPTKRIVANLMMPAHSTAMHAPLGREERESTFGGPFKWRRKPEAGNAENIVIQGDWEEANIVTVEIPQLRKVPGNFSRMRWNKRGVEQLRALWADWDKAGLLGLVLSYEGSFVPRLIRGSTSALSNHAYGSAFDINYEWNQLGKTPAALGKRGCVRELVPIAHEHGFYWGGNFTRLDGMHFEICKLL